MSVTMRASDSANCSRLCTVTPSTSAWMRLVTVFGSAPASMPAST
jgi:hypothetical protein